MSNEQAVPRLVSFLGKPRQGGYNKTTYQSPIQPSDTCETEFVAEALATFLKPQEIVVLATDDAWNAQGSRLQACIEKLQGPTLRRVQLASGQNESELWSVFETIKNELRLPDSSSSNRIALDITHGFRSIPFFAAGIVTFLNLVDESPPDFSVYYGAFEAGCENLTPIWDLTPFTDLISWSAEITLFLKTGRATGLADATDDIGRSLRKEWATSGQHGEAPNLGQLGQALSKFGGDLETVRTGSLMLGDSSVSNLLNAIDNANDSVNAVPPLADVLKRIRGTMNPLRTDARLSEQDGIKALQSLARLYFKMGRFAEAASTMREASINQFACQQSDSPGQSTFSKEHREAAENSWFGADENRAKEIGQVRNDIEHAGYNSQPMPPETLKNKVKQLVDNLYCEETTENE